MDTTDARALAEFYRQLLGYRYRPGDEPSAPGEPDPADEDWLVLIGPSGKARLAFQQVAELPATTWPDGAVPQQLHLDLSVPDKEQLLIQDERARTPVARASCATVSTTPKSPSTCTPIPPDTRSGSSSPPSD